MLNWQRSKDMYLQASKVIPGGVNSPVRAFGSVGGSPLFLKSAKGAFVWDEDGNKYIDYVGSWGPAVLGHSHPEVIDAVCEAAQLGLSFGAPTETETLLANEIQKAMPSLEKIRFVSSGTEACMSAIRLARGYTGREKILKFSGHYHGHADMLLVQAGSGVATCGIPGSAGVPEAAVKDTIVAPYNDFEAAQKIFDDFGNKLACVIVEGIAGNAGFIRPRPGFLQHLRKLCDDAGTLLILDEVMTGFRVARGGVQSLEDVKPDLTTLGKIVGGGMPLAAYGGRRDILDKLAPIGNVYQAGTLSGNPIATACGLKTLQLLSEDGVYQKLEALTQSLMLGLKSAANNAGIDLSYDFEGGMFGMYFSEQPVLNFSDAQQSKTSYYTEYFKNMLLKGVYLAPSAYEAGFMSLAHTDKEVQETIKAAEEVFTLIGSHK